MPWQLYTDKMHLRHVVRDYCIQSGANSGITANSLNELLWRRYRVEMARSSLYRVKTIALGEIHGSHDIPYSYLPGYCEACTTLWQTVGRRYCCKHLSVNWKKVFPGPKMWQLFWLATSATSAFTFKKVMQAIEKHKPTAKLWLANLGEEQDRWSKHKFNTDLKCDVNKTNVVESFNSMLGLIDKGCAYLLERIRRVTMVRIATRRQVCERWERTDLCPKIIKRGEYEIVDGKSNLAVSLNNHTCQCNAWQLIGIPCKHGLRAILHAELDPHTFVHKWNTIKRYKMAYDHGINSPPDMEQWPDSNMPKIQPPPIHRGVGRPCRERKRGDDEERKGKRSKTIRCAICKEFGHNKLTCKGGNINKQNKSNKKATNESGTTKAPDKQEHGLTTSNARK
ncbi:Zinc finger CCHC domain-containing protein 12 [Bienertia sinuspersici]